MSSYAFTLASLDSLVSNLERNQLVTTRKWLELYLKPFIEERDDIINDDEDDGYEETDRL